MKTGKVIIPFYTLSHQRVSKSAKLKGDFLHFMKFHFQKPTNLAKCIRNHFKTILI